MDQVLNTKLDMLDSKLEQIIAILHQVRPSSYSQSITYRKNKKTGHYEREDKRTPEDTFSD